MASRGDIAMRGAGANADARRTPTPAAPEPDAFRAEFSESLAEVLDVTSWRTGRDPAEEYARIEREVADAVRVEDQAHLRLRNEVLPMLAETDLPEAGHYEVSAAEVVQAQQGLLFNGAVQACDGTNDVHDTLALTIYQLGVALVSYTGPEQTVQIQLFRRDLRTEHGSPVDSVLELLQRRRRRPGMHAAAMAADGLSELARRGVTSYMERYVLVHRATAAWRMGHGSPAPLELIGTGFTDLEVRSIRLVRALVEHGRFVFVGSEQAHRGEVTIGHALRPMEYAVIGTLDDYLHTALDRWRPQYEPTEDLHWHPDDPRPLTPREWMARFREEVAGQIVYGLYRATLLAGPQLFFAHRDHVHTAARLALADSRFAERRGFPMLIDLADGVCKAVYGGGSLREMADTAYARAGAPFRFQSERHTRTL